MKQIFSHDISPPGLVSAFVKSNPPCSFQDSSRIKVLLAKLRKYLGSAYLWSANSLDVSIDLSDL